jgi:hypothetical protein
VQSKIKPRDNNCGDVASGWDCEVAAGDNF